MILSCGGTMKKRIMSLALMGFLSLGITSQAKALEVTPAKIALGASLAAVGLVTAGAIQDTEDHEPNTLKKRAVQSACLAWGALATCYCVAVYELVVGKNPSWHNQALFSVS